MQGKKVGGIVKLYEKIKNLSGSSFSAQVGSPVLQ